MHTLEFILGLLERESPCLAQEDFEGPHGDALRLWQQMGFVRSEPGMNPVASCPHCCEGVPYRIGGRYLCNECFSTVDPRQLLLWELDLKHFLGWLAQGLKLRGGVGRVDDHLWKLGCLETGDGRYECFFQRGQVLSAAGLQRLSAYRNVLVLYGLTPPSGIGNWSGSSCSLLQLLNLDKTLSIADPTTLLRPRGKVRFDTHSGVLWAGNSWLGEVPVGSREFFFLDCLARNLDHFTGYADIKHHVLRQSGSTDATEEGTFCQQLKNRIKRKQWISEIDRLLVTTNKGDGYRLRGFLEE